MSSPMTQQVSEGMNILSQNYHIVCHNPEYHFLEILEYKIDYSVDAAGKIARVSH